jgi:hypothetical protein
MKLENGSIHCKDMMDIAQNNKLSYLNIIHLKEKVHMSNIL